jgi:hypothetical protein
MFLLRGSFPVGAAAFCLTKDWRQSVNTRLLRGRAAEPNEFLQNRSLPAGRQASRGAQDDKIFK